MMKQFVSIVLALVICGIAVPSYAQQRMAAAGAAATQKTPPPAAQPSVSVETAKPPAGADRSMVLGVGDLVRITVFQNPDMTTEARVSEAGTITFPLLGAVRVAGMTPAAAEQMIAEGLRRGGYVVQPQVNVFVTQLRSRQVSILGQVGRPGKYPVEDATTRLVDMIALAGGSTGADTITLMKRNGDGYTKTEVDLPELFLKGDLSRNVEVANGDIVYVQRAPMYYVYGEVSRPGVYRLERNMTVMQALATAGGLTPRGSDRGIRVSRRDASEQVRRLEVALDDMVQQDDVIYIRQSWF